VFEDTAGYETTVENVPDRHPRLTLHRPQSTVTQNVKLQKFSAQRVSHILSGSHLWLGMQTARLLLSYHESEEEAFRR
jgi:hypothetical protein